MRVASNVKYTFCTAPPVKTFQKFMYRSGVGNNHHRWPFKKAVVLLPHTHDVPASLFCRNRVRTAVSSETTLPQEARDWSIDALPPLSLPGSRRSLDIYILMMKLYAADEGTP